MLTTEENIPVILDTSCQHDLIESIATSFINHHYLDKTIKDIKETSLPWQEYQSSGLLTEDEVAMIKHVEHATPGEIDIAMSEHGIHYAGLYLDLIDKLARVDAIKKVLVLIQDMLDGHEHSEERIALFHQASKGKPRYPFSPFHKVLSIGDEFIGVQSSKILTLLICSTNQRDVDIEDLFRWMTFQLQSQSSHVIELNIQILSYLFHIPSYRLAFWNTVHAMDLLITILKRGNSDPQKTYEVLFCIWLLSFDNKIASQLNSKYDVIFKLVDIAKSAVKEKVVRIIMSIFRNLIERAPKNNIAPMLVADVISLVQHLSARKWADQELVEDLHFIQEELETTRENLTTFELYAAEIETGKLEWSPPHKSDSFWKENVERFNEHDHHLLKQLTRLLHSTQDPTVLAIALHDLGQYVKYVKDGKRHLEAVGAKQKIMELLTYNSEQVRFEALRATQKYFAMVS